MSKECDVCMRDVDDGVTCGECMPDYSAELAELRDLRALLATPWDHTVSQPPRSYGEQRVIFRLHRGDHVVTADHAEALGAALIRAALTSRSPK